MYYKIPKESLYHKDMFTIWIDFQVKKVNTMFTYMYVQKINKKEKVCI